MSEPKISAVMPVYKGERYVAQSIESVLAQTYGNVELVVINNGSPDGSPRVIERYLALPNVKYVVLQENRGIGGGYNAGIRASTGDWIGFCDCDDLWLPGKAALQVAYARDNPEVGLIHGAGLYIDGQGQLCDNPFGSEFPRNVSGACFREVFSANPIMTVAALARRDVIDRVGMFDESISIAADYNLWLRIAWRYPVGYSDQPIVKYRWHGQNTSGDWLRTMQSTVDALEKALSNLPQARQALGKEVYSRRMGNLNYWMAHCYSERSNWLQAGKHALLALSYEPLETLLKGMSPNRRRVIAWYASRLKGMLGFTRRG